MSIKKYLSTTFLAIFSLTLTVSAVNVGDKAPELQIRNWIKNGPVDLKSGLGKNIYVIDFWATYRPHCRQSIPVLSNLQKKYKDQNVVVVGISTEKKDKVEKFVKEQDNMDYSIGIDDSRKTDNAYMSDEITLPYCFVIGKDGTVKWKGHPLELDRVIDRIISGNFDNEVFEKINSLRKDLQQAMQLGNEKEMTKISEQILELDPDNRIALSLRLSVFQRNKEIAPALDFINKMIDRSPDNKQLYFIKINLLGLDVNTYSQIKSAAETVYNKYSNDSVTLNQLAWMLMTNMPFATAPMDVVLKASKQSIKLLPADAPAAQKSAFYDTMGRAYYMVGDFAKAIENQKQAISFAEKEIEKKDLQNTLNYFEAIKKIRESDY